MSLRITFLPGDRIGTEIIAEARNILDARSRGIELNELDRGADRWHAAGFLGTDDWEETLRAHESACSESAGTQACATTYRCGR